MSAALDLDAIEARARAATGNTWRVAGPDYVCSGNQNVAQTLWALADAAHIAGMDPATTLALVARLREAEAALEALRPAPAGFETIVSWSGKRHLAAPDGTPTRSGEHCAMCSPYTYGTTIPEDGIVTRGVKQGHSAASLPMCKSCAKRATVT